MEEEEESPLVQGEGQQTEQDRWVGEPLREWTGQQWDTGLRAGVPETGNGQNCFFKLELSSFGIWRRFFPSLPAGQVTPLTERWDAIIFDSRHGCSVSDHIVQKASWRRSCASLPADLTSDPWSIYLYYIWSFFQRVVVGWKPCQYRTACRGDNSGRTFVTAFCGFCCVWSAEKGEEFILGEEMVIGSTDTTAVGPSLYFLPHPTWWRKDGNCTWLVLSSVFSLLTFFIQSVSPHPSPTFSFQHDQVQSALSSFTSPSFTDSRAASNRAAHTKENRKSVINDALFPLWKKPIWRASFVISVLLEPQTQQGFSSKRNYYYAVGTVLYNNLSFWNNFLTDHQGLSYRGVFGEKIMHLGKKIESIMIEIVYMLLLFCIY